MSTIFAARLWCGICPVGALSSICSQNFSLKLPIPQFLRKYGFYLSGLGLGVIIWSEVASHMVRSPRATALLIFSIALPAMVLGMLYRRRAWCRYLCPLGRMIGVFSGCSAIELRANYSICNNDCIAHSCYTGGTECESGCPMFEGPFSLRSNLDCILCGNCIKNCPNNSPQVNLRLPGFELWSSRRFEKTIGFLVPLIMGTQLFRGLEKAGYLKFFMNDHTSRSLMLFILLAAVTGLTFLAFRAAESFMLRDAPGKDREIAGVLSYGLLIMAASFEIAFHLERFLMLGGQLLPVLGRQLNIQLEAYGASGAPWAITTLQIILLLLGNRGSSMVLRRIYWSDDDNPQEKTPLSWRLPLIITTVGYAWLFIAG